jgi:hypothetical protein
MSIDFGDSEFKYVQVNSTSNYDPYETVLKKYEIYYVPVETDWIYFKTKQDWSDTIKQNDWAWNFGNQKSIIVCKVQFEEPLNENIMGEYFEKYGEVDEEPKELGFLDFMNKEHELEEFQITMEPSITLPLYNLEMSPTKLEEFYLSNQVIFEDILQEINKSDLTDFKKNYITFEQLNKANERQKQIFLNNLFGEITQTVSMNYFIKHYLSNNETEKVIIALFAAKDVMVLKHWDIVSSDFPRYSESRFKEDLDELWNKTQDNLFLKKVLELNGEPLYEGVQLDPENLNMSVYLLKHNIVNELFKKFMGNETIQINTKINAKSFTTSLDKSKFEEDINSDVLTVVKEEFEKKIGVYTNPLWIKIYHLLSQVDLIDVILADYIKHSQLNTLGDYRITADLILNIREKFIYEEALVSQSKMTLDIFSESMDRIRRSRILV